MLYPVLGLGRTSWMSVAERAFDVLSSHLRLCNIFERCIQRSFEVSKTVSEKVNRSPRGSRVVSSIEDARGVFDLMNFRPTPDDLRRAQRVSEHEYVVVFEYFNRITLSLTHPLHVKKHRYDILQHDKVESLEDDTKEEEDEDDDDDDDEIRPKPGSYIQRRRRQMCSRLFRDHHIRWNDVPDHVIMELIRVTRNLCNAVKHARRYALNQLNTLIRPELESAWRWLLEWQRWKHAHLKCRDMNMFQSRVTKTQLKDFVEIYAMVYAQCLPNISSNRMRISSNQSIEEATWGHTPDQASRWKQDVSKNLHALIDRTVCRRVREY